MKNFRLLKYQTHDPLSENLMKILKNLTPLLEKPVFLEKIAILPVFQCPNVLIGLKGPEMDRAHPITYNINF